MKTCPNCKTTGIPDDANFCPECGEPFDVFADVELKTFPLIGEFSWENTATFPCSIIINSHKVIIDYSTSTLRGLFASPEIIEYSEITHAVIITLNDYYYLRIQNTKGVQGYFAGRSIWRNKNNEFVKKIAYIIELYRRMYWHKSKDMNIDKVSIGSFEDAVQDMSAITNEELIEFYKSIK